MSAEPGTGRGYACDAPALWGAGEVTCRAALDHFLCETFPGSCHCPRRPLPGPLPPKKGSVQTQASGKLPPSPARVRSVSFAGGLRHP